MALYAIILAGGASSRFWPLSGDDHPKYLLRADGRHTLLELAWQRACACTDAGRVLVVTGAAQQSLVTRALPALPTANLCVEPARRDTAAAIALGCGAVARRDPQADVLVLPADTLLQPAQALTAAVEHARGAPGFAEAIHVFGVRAPRPETAFGYIEPGVPVAPGVRLVARFREKPGAAQAQEYWNAGFLWNIGCFLFSLPAFDRELARHLPQHSARLRLVRTAAPVAEDYAALDPVSIDYGLIEKVASLRVCELQAEFDDIGTWDALVTRLEALGVPPAQALSAGGEGNYAMGEPATVAVVGESGLLVVRQGDKVLVLKRGHGQLVREVARRAGEKPHA
ncbi:MAG: mannose-1-phosphate guanylyltransferase [Planctomycetes bacterium]|nr:mannose-1-phosphate guanylyltransferase [Planctomycetota bacterium]